MICPLMSIAEGRAAKCKEAACAWWIKPHDVYTLDGAVVETIPGLCAIKAWSDKLEGGTDGE